MTTSAAAAAATTPHPAATSSSNPTVSTHHNGISAGAIAAAVIVPLVVIAALIVGFLLFRRRRQRAAGYPVTTSTSPGNSSDHSRYAEKGGIHGDAEKQDTQHRDSTTAAGDGGPAAAAQQTDNTHEGAYGRGVQTPPQAYTTSPRRKSHIQNNPSTSTIRTTASTIHPYPPVLPPVDTSLSFTRSVSDDALDRVAAAPPAEAAGTTTTGGLQRESSTSTNSNSRDPFATPSPSRHTSDSLTWSPSHDVSPLQHHNYYQQQQASSPSNPAFTIRRPSAPTPPTSTTDLEQSQGQGAGSGMAYLDMFPPSAAASPSAHVPSTYPYTYAGQTRTAQSHLARPAPVQRGISNLSNLSATSHHPSLSPSTAAEFDEEEAHGGGGTVDEVEEARAVVMGRWPGGLGQGQGQGGFVGMERAREGRASVVDMNAGGGSNGMNVHGNEGVFGGVGFTRDGGR